VSGTARGQGKEGRARKERMGWKKGNIMSGGRGRCRQ